MTKERLLQFAKAWSDSDYLKLTTLLTEDAKYKPSIVLNGKQCFKGNKEIIEAIKIIQKFDQAVKSQVKNIFIDGNFGFWEWEYIDVKGIKISGCDVFVFENDKIKLKNAFRKVST